MKKIGSRKSKKNISIYKNIKLNKKEIENNKSKIIQKIIDKSENEISKKSDTMLSISKEDIDLNNNNNNQFLNIATSLSCSNIINNFLKIKECSIVKYGIKISTDKIYYGYCQTCDVNLIHPICIECARICHQQLGHNIREIKDPGNIRCGCGEKMHKITNYRRNSKLIAVKECPYSDLCEKSRLSTLYVVEGKCVCEFCYRMCGYEGRGQPLEKEKEMLQVCECEDLNGIATHGDLKRIYKKFEDILSLKSKLIFGLEPIQFINLLFLGKSSYESLFNNFEEMIQSFNELSPNNLLKINNNFTSTNFYLSLRVFVKILEKEKNSSLAYYSKELVNKFSFKLISNLLNYIIFQDTPIFWNFLSGMLFLYKKINIGYNTMRMGEYKLSDLENISPLQRKIIMKNNKLLFSESHEQISFFIKTLNNLLKNEILSVEAYDVFICICEILERLSSFYLMNTANMIIFCFTFEEMFEYFKKQNSCQKQIELYFVIIKMFYYFIFCYNDNIIFNYLLENTNENLKKVGFIFSNNQLGNLITRHIIRIMYFTLTVTKFNQLNIEDKNKCSEILRIGTKIFSILIEKDNYFTLSNGYSPNDNLIKLLLISEKEIKISKIKEEINIIEEIYLKYYTFEIDKIDILREISYSLERIIPYSSDIGIKYSVIKTNYLNILCKIFYIIKIEENIEKEETELTKKIISYIFNFLFHFIEEDEDNSTLLCSNYILKALIKLPDTYLLLIFKLYEKSIDLIQKNRGIFCDPIKLIETLYNCLVNYKKNSFKIWKKEAVDFFIDDIKIIDQVIFFFLVIIVKIFLQMKLLYPFSCEKFVKQILLNFLENFEFNSLINYNACLLLLLINKIFDSSEESERELIIKYISLDKMKHYLEDTNILIDLRTQILIFIYKFYFSSSYKSNDNIKKNLKHQKDNSHKENKSKNKERKKKIIHTKVKKKINLNNSNILKVNINMLFHLNDEEPLRNNFYLNALGQDNDEFSYLKENALISNYQYPSKSLTFYYYIKNEQEDVSIYSKIFNLFEEEIKRFKYISEKNFDNNKILKYYIKGILFPFCSIIKSTFCNVCEFNGRKILNIYDVIMKMMYLKIMLIENNNYLNNKKKIEFNDFDLDGFFNKENNDIINDFYILKERHKSPFDFTFLWKIFQKYFLNYIKYPDSLNLETNFPINKISYLKYGNIIDEIDILEEINSNLKKKSVNSLIKRKNNPNLLLLNDNINFGFNANNINNNTNININIEQIINLRNKAKKIFDFYYNEKRNLKINNSSLLSSLSELCSEYEANYRKLLLCLIINIPKEINEYDLIYKIIFYKLLVLSENETQSDIIDLMGSKDEKDQGFLVNYCNALYINIIKVFIDDLNIDYIRYKTIHINIFCISKILKLLCESHNIYFQEKLTNSIIFYFSKLEQCSMNLTMKSGFFSLKKSKSQIFNSINLQEDYMSFFNFLLSTLHKFLIITKNAKEEEHISYLYDLFYSLIELLKEMIQGNKKELLHKINNEITKEKHNDMTLFIFQTFVSLDKNILFNDSLIYGSGFKIRLLLMSFFIVLLEEKTNKELQKIIMKFLTINNVLESINFTLKNFFIGQTRNDIKYRNYYENYNEKQIIQREIIFDDNIYSFFKDNYFYSDILKSSQEFKLANSYYIYIKKISINDKSVEAKYLIRRVDALSESEAKRKFSLFNKKMIKSNEISPINLTNENEKSISTSYIQHYYIIKFFELITKIVEIRIPHEHRNVSVIFTVPSGINYLTNMTKKEFIYNVDRSNENSKKCELVRSVPLFQLEIEYFKNIKVSFLSRIILSIDFIYIQIIMYLIATALLIIMLFTLEGYTGIEPVIESNENLRRLSNISPSIRILVEIPSYITQAIEGSINKYGLIYDFIDYGFVFLNGIFILSWITVKLPLYYIFDKFKYKEEKRISKDEDLTFGTKMYIGIIHTILYRDYINSLIYMFIISLIGAIMKRGEIIYAFILLAIIDLNKTIKGIAISIKEKGSDLVAAFLLLVFIVYFYSNVGFFFFNDHFEADIEDNINDNYCLSLTFCFLTNFDAGIRARGGAADQMVRISFERHTASYIYRLFYDITYFLICIIIMIDLTFGIVLGTFSEKSEEERKHDNDKINHCFICHITREIIEKKRENFNIHREQKHNMWNYVEYMIYLKFSDFHELSTYNAFAKSNLEKKNVCFLPTCQDDFEEDKIVEENIIEENNEKSEDFSDEYSDLDKSDIINTSF